MVIIGKNYNHSAFNNIWIAKLYSSELVIAKAKNKERVEDIKKNVIKLDNLKKSNKSNRFLKLSIYK